MIALALFIAVFCAVNSTDIPRAHLDKPAPNVVSIVQERVSAAGVPWQGVTYDR